MFFGGCASVRFLTPSSPPPGRLSADIQCKTSATADIVLLVDGSWSIGRMNFKTIRNFIARMVSVFDIGPDKVQIGNVLIAFSSISATTTLVLN